MEILVQARMEDSGIAREEQSQETAAAEAKEAGA
jgi:hypothetical protein